MAFTVVEASEGMITLEYAPPARTSRALSLPLAKAATDFYEVVFVYDEGGAGEKVYRRNFREAQTVRMTVADGSYNNSDNIAYMFAGRYDTKTLLAVGKVSKVEYKETGKYDDGTTNTYDTTPFAEGTFLINGDAKIVTFELTPLTTDLTGNGTEGFSFQSWDIDNKVNDPPNLETHPEANWDYVPGESVKTAKIDGKTVPVFTIPKGLPTRGLINIWLDSSSFVGSAIIIDENNIVFDSKGFFEQGIKAPMATVDITLEEANSHAGGVTLGITMTPQSFVAPGGLGVFTYEIPVHNNNDSPSENNGPAATTWYIRGGISNNLYDLGPDVDSQGGKIVLGVGDLSGLKIFKDTDEDGFYIGGGYRPLITYSVGAANGAPTPSIELTFGAPVPGLTLNDITITPSTVATKGLLTGGPTTWTLDINVLIDGDITVTVAKSGVTTAAQTVTVYDSIRSAGASVSAPTVTANFGRRIQVSSTAPGNGQLVEYAMNTVNSAPASGWITFEEDNTPITGAWTDPTFGAWNQLTMFATYYFFARAKENNDYTAGPISAATSAVVEGVFVEDQYGTKYPPANMAYVAPQGSITFTAGETYESYRWSRSGNPDEYANTYTITVGNSGYIPLTFTGYKNGLPYSVTIAVIVQ